MNTSGQIGLSCFVPSGNKQVITWVNTLRPRQNGRRLADDTFKRIFLNENVMISITISLKFVPKVRISNIPALVQIMAWRLPGGKSLSEPMMVRLLTHTCATRPQWVKCWPRSLSPFSCLRLRHGPVTYLITLSDWIMSCQPGRHAVVTVCEQDWKHKWAAYKSYDETSSLNNL